MQSAALYAIARPSIRPFIRHTVEVRIMQLSPQSSPILLFLRYTFNSEIMTGYFRLSGVIKQGRDDENELFSRFMSRYLENGTRCDLSYY